VTQDLIGTAGDQHAGVVIAGDEVACPGRGAAHRVAGAADLDADAVGQGLATGDIGANIVAQHLIATGAAVDQHAVIAVPGDEVACSGGGAADRVNAAAYLNAVAAVAQEAGAADSGADGVAQHLIAAAGDLHAIAAIAGDKVACPGGCAADHVGD